MGGEKGRAKRAQASLVFYVVAMEERPTSPFSELLSPSREKHMASEGKQRQLAQSLLVKLVTLVLAPGEGLSTNRALSPTDASKQSSQFKDGDTEA